MHRKMDTTIHENSAFIQPPFSATRTGITGKTSPPFERALNSGLDTATAWRFNIYFLFVPRFCLIRTWEYMYMDR
jgi:hypothetical protein